MSGRDDKTNPGVRALRRDPALERRGKGESGLETALLGETARHRDEPPSERVEGSADAIFRSFVARASGTKPVSSTPVTEAQPAAVATPTVAVGSRDAASDIESLDSLEGLESIDDDAGFPADATDPRMPIWTQTVELLLARPIEDDGAVKASPAKTRSESVIADVPTADDNDLVEGVMLLTTRKSTTSDASSLRATAVGEPAPDVVGEADLDAGEPAWADPAVPAPRAPEPTVRREVSSHHRALATPAVRPDFERTVNMAAGDLVERLRAAARDYEPGGKLADRPSNFAAARPESAPPVAPTATVDVDEEPFDVDVASLQEVPSSEPWESVVPTPSMSSQRQEAQRLVPDVATVAPPVRPATEGSEDGQAPGGMLDRALSDMAVLLRYGHEGQVRRLLEQLRTKYPRDLLLVRRIVEFYLAHQRAKLAIEMLFTLATGLFERRNVEGMRQALEQVRVIEPDNERAARLLSLLEQRPLPAAPEKAPKGRG